MNNLKPSDAEDIQTINNNAEWIYHARRIITKFDPKSDDRASLGNDIILTTHKDGMITYTVNPNHNSEIDPSILALMCDDLNKKFYDLVNKSVELENTFLSTMDLIHPSQEMIKEAIKEIETNEDDDQIKRTDKIVFVYQAMIAQFIKEFRDRKNNELNEIKEIIKNNT